MDQTDQPKAKKPNIWFIISLVLAIALIGVLVANYGSPKEEGDLVVVQADAAALNLLDFINEVYGPQIGSVTLKGVEEKNGLYQVTISITNNGQPVDEVVFLTRDGKLFIPQVLDIEDNLQRFHEFQAAQQQQVQPETTSPEE